MSEQTPDWAKQLNVLRQKRGNTVQTDRVSFQEKSLSDAQSRQIQNQYLRHWQHAHNARLPEDCQHVSAQVVLSDEWYEESKHILAHEETIPEGVVRLDVPCTETAQPTDDLFAEEQQTSVDQTSVDKEPILATVLKPDCHQHKPVAVIDEAVLVQQLSDKLSRHLHDAVSGMVSVAVRKHLQKMTLQLEEEFAAQLPEMIEETIQHHLQKIIKEMKSI